LQKNGETETHIRKRMQKTTIKRTWSIGKRIFKENYKRRMKMINSLVGSVALFGAKF